ncbi:hypothetical protein [Treponema sp. R80B11-R83G3]
MENNNYFGGVNIMYKLKILIYIFLVFVLTSCFSTPPKNDAQEAIVYIYQNPSTEYIEFESIGLSMQSKMVMYSIDRDNKLIMMEIGSYSIIDSVITINTKKIQAIGTITDEKIVIDDKEFIRYKK